MEDRMFTAVPVNVPTLLMGMQIGAATMEDGVEAPLKTKNRTTI